MDIDIKNMSRESLLKAKKQRERELEQIEYAIEEKNINKLNLAIHFGDLYIEHCGSPIGVINHKGECQILNSHNRVSDYEKWRKSGMHIDETPVEWSGGVYRLTDDGYGVMLARVDGGVECIYNFEDCRPFANCKDPNIIRHKHNNVPIIF